MADMTVTPQCECLMPMALRKTKANPDKEFFACAQQVSVDNVWTGGCKKFIWKNKPEDPRVLEAKKTAPSCACAKVCGTYLSSKHPTDVFVFYSCGNKKKLADGSWKSGCTFYRRGIA